MKKLILVLLAVLLLNQYNAAQIRPVLKSDSITKKTSLPAKVKTKPAILPSAISNEGTKSESVYSLTAAKLAIRTGGDNKEYPSKFLFYLWENSGIWGEGRGLYTQPDINESVKELKANSDYELILVTPQDVNTNLLTLANLQNKGLRFTIYYFPNFFADAWKIERVNLTLEFKDQFGRLHPTMGTRIIQFNISNGILSKSKSVMTGTTDLFFTPQPVTITDK